MHMVSHLSEKSRTKCRKIKSAGVKEKKKSKKNSNRRIITRINKLVVCRRRLDNRSLDLSSSYL